jgi:hypothetical protein
MAILTAKTRAALKPSDFALNGSEYPIHDLAHAKNALSRVSQDGTPAEKIIVRRKVKVRYPEIDQSPDKSADKPQMPKVMPAPMPKMYGR